MAGRRYYIDDNGDVTELDADFFAEAATGIPPALAGAAREEVNIALDADILSRLRAEGGDWRDRVNALLRRALEARG